MADTNNPNTKVIIAAVIFALAAVGLSFVVPTTEIAWVCAILLLTIYLFAFEVVEVDVAAISIMVLLGCTTLLAPLMGIDKGLISTQHVFDGFASNAVMSIIAVMIIGAGLDKTGIMNNVAAFILKIGGTTEKRIIPILSGTVAFISSFMQNVGAAALFLPVVSRISARSGLPMSRLLMPMGFCAILGGTMTMVGSSPLILLNDLILTSNQALPAEQQMATWSLFSVTPIGIVMVTTGILYFIIAGRFVLPVTKKEENVTTSNTMEYFREIYGLDYCLNEVMVPADSPIAGKVINDIEQEGRLRVIAAMREPNDMRIGPGGVHRDLEIEPNTILGILASQKYLDEFVKRYGLVLRTSLTAFSEVLSASKAGIGEVVIPPGSHVIGKSARDIWLRKKHGIAMIGLHRDGETLREGDGIRDLSLKAGDALVTHSTWEALARLETDRDFVVVTTEYPHEEIRAHKVGWAGLFFSIALCLVLFTDLRLSVALLVGALGMILSGVLKIDEAYVAVSWKTVFLLASLIPLGLAVETTGTAKWIAEQTLIVMGGMPVWSIQLAVAVLATFFTLVMSNVGATVLLVPLAVNIAIGLDADPAMFALTVALATSNSFLIPTHQVNALIMGPGGYRVPDFIRAGSIMTILFLAVIMIMLNWLY